MKHQNWLQLFAEAETADPAAGQEPETTLQTPDPQNAETRLSQAAPVIEALARRFGQDPQNPDYETLARAVSGQTDAEQAQRLFYARHFQNLEQQSEAMKTVFPAFDLRMEMQNPVFARLVRPGVDIPVEDAYYAVHRRELQAAAMEVAAHSAARKISGAIAAGTLRPQEAGQTGQAASVAKFDYRNASREQREALRQRIREAAARGEKLYP